MPTPKFKLAFPGCKACLAKPCERLRFGRVHAGKFLFVHKRYCGAPAWDCPFVPAGFDEVRLLARDESLVDLAGRVEDVMSQLSIAEFLAVRQENHVAAYGDYEGRLDFLETLWNAGALTAVRVPQDFMSNRSLAGWLLANETLAYQFERTAEEDSAGPAITDAAAEQQQQQVTISNPRWEHVDQDRKKNSPDKATFGDTITLMADVQGLADGASVSFSIYDTTASPPMRVDTVSGTNQSGTAQAQWEVKDPRDDDDTRELKLEFEASARSKTTERCAIPTESIFRIRLHIDPNSQESANDIITLFSTDADKTYSCSKTVHDDKTPGDAFLDLEFTGVTTALRYTLTVDPGKQGEPYHVFVDVDGSELLSGAGDE